MKNKLMLLVVLVFALAITTACPTLDYSVLDETPFEERIYCVYSDPDTAHIPTLVGYNVTHVIVNFYNPKVAEGDMTLVRGADKTADDLLVKNFITLLKVLNPDIKVLMALGGWDVGQPSKANYAEFSKPENVKAFVTSTLEQVNELGFDGIDFDVEGPDIPRHIDTWVAETVNQFHADGKLVTAALFSLFDKTYPAMSDESLHSLDFLNVMSYNYSLASYNPFPTNCASLDDFQKEIDYWHYRRKLPLNQIVMGVPYYSQMWVTNGENSEPSWKYVYTECLLPAGETDYYKDDIEKIWKGMNSSGKEVAIDTNNPAVMKEKATLARKLGGIMVWHWSQDYHPAVDEEDNSLSRVISETLFKE